mmetsp:Transcript_24029/g.63130  ORF Transcript_24029/g.63130 Transcript_24029/m.63130 type:complete len:252 (+) Transcript_24029:2474-3229(+)
MQDGAAQLLQSLLVHPPAFHKRTQSLGSISPSEHLGPLLLPLFHFQLLVILKEVLYFPPAVRRNLLQGGDVARRVLLGQHCYQLFVPSVFVLHVHDANEPAIRNGASVQAIVLRLYRTNHKHVDWISIATKCLRHVSVVAWVVQRRVKHAVQHQLPRFLFYLVLIQAASRHLDHHGCRVVSKRDPSPFLFIPGKPVPEIRFRRCRLVAYRRKRDDTLIGRLLPMRHRKQSTRTGGSVCLSKPERGPGPKRP